MDQDWRLTPGNERLFRGAVFVAKRFTQWSPQWDHDHCSFCWDPFAEEGSKADRPEAHHEGYSTPGPPHEPKEDYYWVCADCFADFREYLGWTVRGEPDQDLNRPPQLGDARK
jgi:hypothetical protein